MEMSGLGLLEKKKSVVYWCRFSKAAKAGIGILWCVDAWIMHGQTFL